MAKLDADGPARRSSSVSPAWWTGPPPIHSPRTATGHDRMTRPSRRSPPQEAACGFWIRAWSQREPALRGTGRLNSPAPLPELAQGWAGHSLSPHAECSSLRIEHPLRTLSRCAWSLTGRVGIFVFHPIARLLESRSPPRDASAGRSRPLPGCCPHRIGCPTP